MCRIEREPFYVCRGNCESYIVWVRKMKEGNLNAKTDKSKYLSCSCKGNVGEKNISGGDSQKVLEYMKGQLGIIS